MSAAPIPYRGPPNPRQNEDKLLKLIDRLYKTTQRLKPTNRFALSATDLRRDFGVVLQRLDPESGQPCSQGDRFVDPVPAKQVDAWLDQFAPQMAEGMEPRDFEFTHPDFNATRDTNGGLIVSIDMKERILRYVTMSQRIELGCILHNETKWRLAPVDSGCLSRHNIPRFEVTEVFHQCAPGQSSDIYRVGYTDPDPQLPHLQCWLHDDSPLTDDKYLTVGELQTILLLALTVITYPPHRQALVVPVTVYSCSFRKIRIVQGCVDFRNDRIDVRCSPVEDFTTGGLQQSPSSKAALLRILGWVCGKPVGPAMPGAVQGYSSARGRPFY